jgi:hypothetical protein
MAVLDDPKAFTPYSTIKPLFDEDDMLVWVPELDRDRILAYQKYEEIYWSHQTAFELKDVTQDGMPLYIPNPMTIVDTTSHFFMKGLEITATGRYRQVLEDFMDREMFIPKFHEAKHSGVVRGDFILHVTADPEKPEGTRVSINSVDPAMYFPEFDDDDLDRVKAVNLVETVLDPDRPEGMIIRRQRYSYVLVGTARKVLSQQATYEVKEWWNGRTAVKLKDLAPPAVLPDPITQIPVYAYKNKPWQGQPFGSSELKGHEALQARVNQSATDEDVALSLEGLGVYATDAPQPTQNFAGREVAVPWVIAPGQVIEVPTGSSFRRVEGLRSVEPFQAHLKFLTESMYEATATFRPAVIDAQVAASGIALAIKFLPTMAKLEERDNFGVAKTTQLMFDLKAWFTAYDGVVLAERDKATIILGDKLPEDKKDMLNTLNNLLDRKAISKQFYRDQIHELYGIEFPLNIEQQIEDEKRADIELQQEFFEATAGGVPPGQGPPGAKPAGSNNKSRPNESGGTEAR